MFIVRLHSLAAGAVLKIIVLRS